MYQRNRLFGPQQFRGFVEELEESEMRTGRASNLVASEVARDGILISRVRKGSNPAKADEEFVWEQLNDFFSCVRRKISHAPLAVP
jgi:hypothetical protein